MGSTDNFHLQWDDFESNTRTSFRELREDSKFFDVTLCCDNGTDVVPAHQLILASCSPLFHKILSRQRNQEKAFLYLKGVCIEELQAVLDFIYHGEVNIAQDSINRFLAVAEELSIKGLTTNLKTSTPDTPAPQKFLSAKRKASLPPGLSMILQAKKHKPSSSFQNSGEDSAEFYEPHLQDINTKNIKVEPDFLGSGASGMVENDFNDMSYDREDYVHDFGPLGEYEELDPYVERNDFADIVIPEHLKPGVQLNPNKRRKIPIEFKLKLVNEAKETNCRTVGRNHNIDESIIRRWRDNEEKLIECLATGKTRYRSPGGGRIKNNPEHSVFGDNSEFGGFDEYGDCSSDSKKKITRTTHSLEFKLKLVAEAKMTSNRQTGRNHNIEESIIRGWRKNEEKLIVALNAGKTKEGKDRQRSNCNYVYLPTISAPLQPWVIFFKMGFWVGF